MMSHPIVQYITIFILILFIFNKVFRVKRMPILKEILIHLFMAVGAFILFIFQYDKLPIIQSLFVVIGLMSILKVRKWVEQYRKQGNH